MPMSAMQVVDILEIGDPIASVIRNARYDGMYGYQEMVSRACERKMNGIAVSRSGQDAGDCIAILIEGRLHCVIFQAEEALPGNSGEAYVMKKGDEFALFDVEDENFLDFVTSVWSHGRGNGHSLPKDGTAIGLSDFSGIAAPGKNTATRLDGIEHTINSVVLRLDREGHVISLNRFGEHYFGFSQQDLLGRHVVGTLVPEKGRDGEDMRALMAVICRSPEEHPSRSYENMTRDGGRVWNAWTHTPLRDSDGHPGGVLCIGNDITGQMREHRSLRESEEKFRLLVEYSPNMVFFNRDGRILYANEKCEEIMGYSRDELCSSDFNFFTLIAPECMESCRRQFGNRFDSHGTPTGEYTLITKQNERLEVILSTKAVSYLGEEAIIGVVTDITQRKQAEEIIRESENHYRAIFETTGTAMMIIGEDGTTSLANAEFGRLFGYMKGGLEGRKFWKSCFVPEEHAKLIQYHQRRRVDASAAPRTYESRLLDCSGTIRNILMTVSLIPGTMNSVVSIMDITGRKHTELALRESEERYRLLAENAKDVIWTMNMDLEFTYISPSARLLLGYDPEAMMQKRLDRILVPMSLQFAREVFFEERALAQIENKTQAGLRVLELECICNDGSFVWIEAKVTFLRDSEGRPVGILGVARDISERKQIERIKSEAYTQIEKNMEQFAILNDHIRNPLQAIVGLADLEGGPLSDKIYQQAMEIDSIIKRLDIGWIESKKIREFLRKHYQEDGILCR
jgi:PAS domain S-box-containing protein